MKLKIALFLLLSMSFITNAYCTSISTAAHTTDWRNFTKGNVFSLKPWSFHKDKRVFKKVVLVLIVNTSGINCGTLNSSSVSGSISNCSPGPGERELTFLVDPTAGLLINFSLSIPSLSNGKVTIQGYGYPIVVDNSFSGFCSWTGNVAINPSADVTRVTVLATNN